MKATGGQRLLITILTLILMIFGTILGSSGQFPDVETDSVPPIESQAAFQAETVISPDYLVDTVGKGIAPLFLAFMSLVALFRALSQRINNPSDPFKPSDLSSLLQSKEFWIHVVALVVGVGQMAGVQLLDEGAQATIVTGIMSIMSALLWSYGSRPSGVTQDSSKLQLVSVTPQAQSFNDEKPRD